MFPQKHKIIGLLVKVTKQCVRHALSTSLIGLAATVGKKKKEKKKVGDPKEDGRVEDTWSPSWG